MPGMMLEATVALLVGSTCVLATSRRTHLQAMQSLVFHVIDERPGQCQGSSSPKHASTPERPCRHGSSSSAFDVPGTKVSDTEVP
jgi:hypothetical protein